ncbi:MAG: amidohydrolase family protein [Polyangiales bacterium]
MKRPALRTRPSSCSQRSDHALIIDSHAHFEPRMLALDGVIDKMDQAGVDRIVFIPALNDPLPDIPEKLLAVLRQAMKHKATRSAGELIHRATMRKGAVFINRERFAIYPAPDNAAVAEVLRAHPERFLGWIFLNPAHDAGVLDTLERWRQEPGFIGVKLHPHWHDYRTEILGPLLQRCEELGLPVLIHLGFRARGDFRSMASTYPRLKIIAAHAGFPFYGDLWRYKNAHPNLHVDLSSPYIDETLARQAVKAMGPERCLYGTDAPYGAVEEDGSFDYRTIRGWVDRMPCSGRQRDGILGANFARLIGL